MIENIKKPTKIKALAFSLFEKYLFIYTWKILDYKVYKILIFALRPKYIFTKNLKDSKYLFNCF